MGIGLPEILCALEEVCDKPMLHHTRAFPLIMPLGFGQNEGCRGRAAGGRSETDGRLAGAGGGAGLVRPPLSGAPGRHSRVPLPASRPFLSYVASIPNTPVSEWS